MHEIFFCDEWYFCIRAEAAHQDLKGEDMLAFIVAAWEEARVDPPSLEEMNARINMNNDWIIGEDEDARRD